MKPTGPSAAADTWKVDATGAAALLALTALAYFLGAAPLLARHDGVRQQRTDLTAAHEKSLETSRTLARIQRESAQAQQQLAVSPLRLQPSHLLNQRLALVTDLATETGARLDDLQPGKTLDGTQFGVLPIHVAGTGTYTNFAALLRRLRERCPDTGVSGFEISGTPQEGDARSKFSFDLVWYTAATKAEAGKAAGAHADGRK